MSKFSFSSLRSRAIVLILLASLPVLALTIYSYFDQRNQNISDVQRHELLAVSNLAAIQKIRIEDSRRLLITLSQLPHVQSRNHSICSPFFAQLLKQSPQYASIVATDAEGQLFCSAPVTPGPVNYAGRRWFQEVMQSKDFVVGEAIWGRVSGKYGTIVAYPILDDEGRFQGAVAAQLDLEWLAKMLAKSGFPPTTSVIMTDSSRKILFRYPDPEKYIGHTLPDSLVKNMDDSDESEAGGVGLLGEESLFVLTKLSPSQEERVYIGVPLDWAVGPANRALRRHLIVLSLVALFAMASAWYGGKWFIVRPVEKLRAVSERLAAGDMTVRSGPNYPKGELGLLSHSFDQMADSLQAREADLHRANEKLRQEIEVRQAAEMAVETQRQRLYALLDTLPGVIYLMGEDHFIRFANQGFRELFGDPEGKKCYEVVANRSEPCPDCPCLDILNTGIHTQSEWTFPSIPRTFQFFKYPFVDYDGSSLVLGLAIDITERKQAEEALRESELRFRTIFEGAAIGITMRDDQRRLIACNPAYQEMLGYSDAELKGKCAPETIHPDDVDKTITLYQELVSGKQQRAQHEVRYRHKDGKFFWCLVTYSLVRGPQGEPLYSIGMVEDITRRKVAEEALQESEMFLKETQRIARLGGWKANPDIDYLRWTDGVYDIIEAPRDYQPGLSESLKFYLPEYHPLLKISLKKCLATSEPFTVECQVKTATGKILWAEVRGLRTWVAGGEANVIGTLQDITQRKVAEENIHFLFHELMRAQEQERHKISLELHDTVAQELASIKIGLEALRDNPRPTTDEKGNSSVTGLLEKLKHSLNSLRTLSYNLRPPDLEHMGLAKAIQILCEEVVFRTGLRIDFKTAGIEAARLDYEAAINLYRIVQEGLTNVWRHARAKNVNIRLVASYPKIILRLEDDGQGFNPAKQLALNRLNRRMGLLGMKERIAFLGGEMDLESQLKKGTKIKIEIPWSRKSHVSEEKGSYS